MGMSEQSEGFYAGPHLGRVVSWEENRGMIHGIVEAQKPGWLRIFVFNKTTYGNRRAVKRTEDVLLT